MRRALAVVIAAGLAAAWGPCATTPDSTGTQTIFRCKACFTDAPSTCGSYVGDCYGAASKSMPARSMDEAKETAAEYACTARYGGRIGPSGPAPGCRLGPSYTDADRKASLAHFTFTCDSFAKRCDR